MEAGTFLRTNIPFQRISNPKRLLSRRLHGTFPRFIRASSTSANSNGRYRGPKPGRDWVAEWVSKNDDVVRSLPIYAGGVSLLAVLFNRTVSGIAPVADASSSQSRADLLTLGLAVTNILAGLVWLSIRPKPVFTVNPDGIECHVINPDLPNLVVSELLWTWESLSEVTCGRSLVVVYNSSYILQIGFAAESLKDNGKAASVDAGKLMQGSLCRGVMKSGAQSYLANLSLYPGKSELPFLPSNTQAWISLIGEKLDATLAKYFDNVAFSLLDQV
ncbi:protein COFACTOR ASSEMBLY OF COMPLEX C SUBUNIT B CCB4, chloroplastic isoform X2 [Humulus lupulus]|uniref:protein COFACTOR ASSEMBLY OF COMPLEX C SUBUNIT B CCB4, chloroplastic isoform X2 n=1 Tax=Humulus lupulus TaxID=3486 RepID=UPI002B40B6BB|nr:protein COFACTOR ASSEMBLY OF COMPLEX C SUBUNIT B CCB4, chloroplastic isoform X2 [Humulus lupulus]